MGRWDGKVRKVLNNILEFCLVYPELCQSLFLYLGGGNGSFLKIGWGDGITGLSKMCCAMLWCILLHCTVIPCVCVMLYRVMPCLILKCTAANHVNKLKNVFYMIICDGPCVSRLDEAVNVITL